nr:hypothetical protein [Tanacetum cinerariifolium]
MAASTPKLTVVRYKGLITIMTQHLFIKGKKHGSIMLDSIDNGPLVYPTIEENRIINPQETQQVAARDEKWVSSVDRVKISSSNLRLETTMPQKEETFQVMIDVIKNSTYFKAFTISANVPEIFTMQFWYMIKKILDICPRVKGKGFTELQNDDDTFTLLLDLGYKGTRTESEFKCAFMTLSGQDIETFSGTMFLYVEQLEKKLDKEDFQEIGSMAAFNEIPEFRDTLIQHLESVKKSIDERAQLKREYDCWWDIIKRAGYKQQIRNDTHDDGAYIRPIYDEEPMDKVQTTAEINVFAIGSGFEIRPPMLNKENYVPWSSRLLRYAKSRPNGKLIHNSIINGPYVRRMIPEPGDTNREVLVNETFHVHTDDELTEKELKQIKADDQAI